MDLKIFKIKKKFKKSEHQPDPDFFWKIVLSVTAILVLLSFAFGAYLFFKINKEDVESEVQYDGQAKKISKERLDRALQYFTDRSNKSSSIINSPAPVSDPSL